MYGKSCNIDAQSSEIRLVELDVPAYYLLLLFVRWYSAVTTFLGRDNKNDLILERVESLVYPETANNGA